MPIMLLIWTRAALLQVLLSLYEVALYFGRVEDKDVDHNRLLKQNTSQQRIYVKKLFG
jgi:hypothetical protein